MWTYDYAVVLDDRYDQPIGEAVAANLSDAVEARLVLVRRYQRGSQPHSAPAQLGPDLQGLSFVEVHSHERPSQALRIGTGTGDRAQPGTAFQVAPGDHGVALSIVADEPGRRTVRAYGSGGRFSFRDRLMLDHLQVVREADPY